MPSSARHDDDLSSQAGWAGCCALRYGTGLAPATVGQGRTWIEVDLAALAANIGVIRRAIGDRSLMAVVKANAYGLGMAPVACAALAAGADALGVATSEEALALRAAGIVAPILIMGHAHPDHAEALVAADVTVALYTPETARALAAAAARLGTCAKGHLKIDTGLCRVGVAPAEATEFAVMLQGLSSLDVEGAFTHFSCADDGDRERTAYEHQMFLAALDELAAAGHPVRVRHAAATAAFLDSPDTWLDMVRIGIGIHGYYPYAGCSRSVPLTPVMSMKTRISRLRRVPAGTGVGYGLSYKTKRATTIATLPVGYGDGLDKRLGNKGHVLVRGRRVPRAGGIAMDLSMIDVGDAGGFETGDEVVIVGRQGDECITLEEVAATAGTSIEHILAQLSGRPSRVYTGAVGGPDQTVMSCHPPRL